MRFSRSLMFSSLFLLLSISGGCGTSGGGGSTLATGAQQPATTTQPAGDLSAGLPAPRSLLAEYIEHNSGKHTSYEQADLIKFGREHDDFFPHRNISDVGDSVEFQPLWSEATGKTLGRLSYCTYPFTIPDYDLAPQVRYGWSDPPDDLQTVWLGLANWSKNSWDWYRAETDGILSLPTFDPYISTVGDYFFILVLHASVDVSSLHYIGLGPNQVTAAIRAAPKYALPPTHATASSAASSTAVGTIAKHEFDWDEDGVFEDDAGPVGASVHDVDSLGTYSVAVRVTNSFGEQDTAADTYSVIEPWQHSWGLEEEDTYYAVASDGMEYCYAAGSLTSSSNGLQIVLLKYSLAGAFQWARAWGSTQDDCALGVACYEDKVFLTGYTANYGADGKDVLVQCWNTNGDVEWTRTWGGNEDDAGNGIALTPTDIYICGEERVSSASASNALLLKYSQAGSLIWEEAWGGGQNDTAKDILSYYDIMGPVYRLYLTGTTEGSGGHSDVLYLSFTADGNLAAQRAWQCNEVSHVWGNAIALTGYPPQLYIAGRTGFDKSLMLEVGVATDAIALSWGGVREDEACDLVIKDDHILVCGLTEWLEDLFLGYLMDLSPSGGFNGYKSYESDFSAKFRAISAFPGTGLLLAGSGTSAVSGEWSDSSPYLSPNTGTWSNLSGTLLYPTGVTASPSAAGIAVNYGVKDVGADSYRDDTALVATGLP